MVVVAWVGSEFIVLTSTQVALSWVGVGGLEVRVGVLTKITADIIATNVVASRPPE